MTVKTRFEPPRSALREERSLNPFAHFNFGDPVAQQEELYIQVRSQYTQDRWKEGHDRLLKEEAAAYRFIKDEHEEIINDIKRNTRRLHWTLMQDFEHLCEQHMTMGGITVEEEDARRVLYEAWLEDYERTLPHQRQWEIDRTAALVRKQCEAKRARQAYEEHLQTLDELDMCRRDQTRGRMQLYQQWHDTVVVRLHRWHTATVSLLELRNLELYVRSDLTIQEEDVRALELTWYEQDLFLGCIVAEEYERMRLVQEEMHETEATLVREGLYTLQYELWWLIAKDIPRRWIGETLPEDDHQESLPVAVL